MFGNADLEAPPAAGEADVSVEAWMTERGATPRMLAVAEACYANDFGCSLRQLGLRETIEEARRCAGLLCCTHCDAYLWPASWRGSLRSVTFDLPA